MFLFFKKWLELRSLLGFLKVTNKIHVDRFLQSDCHTLKWQVSDDINTADFRVLRVMKTVFNSLNLCFWGRG